MGVENEIVDVTAKWLTSRCQYIYFSFWFDIVLVVSLNFFEWINREKFVCNVVAVGILQKKEKSYRTFGSCFHFVCRNFINAFAIHRFFFHIQFYRSFFLCFFFRLLWWRRPSTELQCCQNVGESTTYNGKIAFFLTIVFRVILFFLVAFLPLTHDCHSIHFNCFFFFCLWYDEQMWRVHTNQIDFRFSAFFTNYFVEL